MNTRSIFDFPYYEILEYTPRNGQIPPKGIGKGNVAKKNHGKDIFEDDKYYYVWDGKHDGGEWEVYSKSSKEHDGVIDPKTGNWHEKKGAKPGRRIVLFAVLARSRGAIAFGPIVIEDIYMESLSDAARIATPAENIIILESLDQLGIRMPPSMYWRFTLGNEISSLQLKDSLIQHMEEINERFQQAAF